MSYRPGRAIQTTEIWRGRLRPRPQPDPAPVSSRSGVNFQDAGVMPENDQRQPPRYQGPVLRKRVREEKTTWRW
jgi:hypothetical protein